MRRAFVGITVIWGLAGCGSDPGSGVPNGGATGGSTAPPNVAPEQGAGGSVAAPVPPPTSTTVPTNTAAPQPTALPPPAAMPTEMPSAQGMPTATAPPSGTAAPPDPPVPLGVAPPEGFKPNAMDECSLNSGWPGDEYCIAPPPPDKGFQVHFGPSNYANPEPEFILQPGQEWVHRFTATAPIDEDVVFYVRQYRMRPGAHHTIVVDTGTGRRLSGSDVNQDHPVGGVVAPENADVGIPLAAHSLISADHHAINTTSEPLLQEVWVNFWYVDPAQVKETTTLLYDPGSLTDTVGPHEDVVLGPWQCDIQSPGRLINMFGHVHANDVRFTAWRNRGGQRDLIYESYHWEEPLWLEYTSLAENRAPDPVASIDGGWSGVLDLLPGDTLEWECHEVNEQDTTLRFTNKTYEGWMCIVIGELVGTSCKSRTGINFNPIFE